MATLKKGQELSLLKERLGVFFILLILQVTLYRLLGQQSFSVTPLLTSLFYLGISYFFLKEQLKGQFLNDYFIEKKANQKNKHKELLVHGEIIESDLEDEEKEQRFLRVAGLSNKIKRRAILLIYIGSFLLGRHLVNTFSNESSLMDHLLPLGLGTVILLTTTYGQLLALPLLALLIGVFSLPAGNNFDISELITLSLSLFIGLSSIRIILTLPELLNKKSSKLGISVFTEVKGPVFHLVLCLWLVNTIIPDKTNREKPDLAERMNQKLGKTFKSPSKEVRQLRSKVNKTSTSPLGAMPIPFTLPSFSFQEALNQMGSQLDFYKDLFNSDVFNKLAIPEMEKNYLINTHKEISNDYKELKEKLSKKKEFTSEDIEAAFDFFKKLQNLQNELKGFDKENIPTFFEKISRPEEAFHKAFNQALKEDIGPYEEVFKKEGLNEKAPDLDFNLFKSDKEEGLSSYRKFEQKIELAQASKDTISKLVIEREKKESNLIDPDLLQKILRHTKVLFFITLGVGVIKFVLELFSKEKVLTTDSKEAKTLKKSFLKKFTYHSKEEEICDRYNKFLEATKKIYFEEEEEPPPPKILEAYLRRNSQHNQKALNFLTEVFSHTFYGGHEFPNKALLKYRKAYRSLIKSL